MVLPITTAQTHDDNMKIEEARSGIETLLNDNKSELRQSMSSSIVPELLFIAPLSQLVVDIPLTIVQPGESFSRKQIYISDEAQTCKKIITP